MSQPIGTPSDGYSKILWVAGQGTISNPASPSLAQITPAADDFSLYYTEFTPNLSENTAATPRINTEFTPTRPGRAQRTIATAYVSNPQVPAQNLAELTLIEKLIGYYVERVGFPHAQALAEDDVVNIYLVQLGLQNPSRAADNDWIVAQTAYVQAYWRAVTVVA